ncbi:MAG: endolytic transglycosylase MltG [Oscillospiraceae bacterium]|nr:endolytic transglycosylase MltG [Oscillospiraceae bacterium]
MPQDPQRKPPPHGSGSPGPGQGKQIPRPNQGGGARPANPQQAHRNPVPGQGKRPQGVPAPGQGQHTQKIKPIQNQTPGTAPGQGQHTQKINPMQNQRSAAPGTARPDRDPPRRNTQGASPGQRGVAYAKRKKENTGCLRGVLYTVSVLAVSFFTALFVWSCADDVLALMDQEGQATVEVEDSYTISEVSRTLKKSGIIKHAWLFSYYANRSETSQDIEPGIYDLPKNLDYHAILRNLRKHSDKVVVAVTIPEGKNVDETIDILVEAGVSTRELLEKTMAENEFDFSFLKTIPTGDYKRLEGYLFPDKYDFYTNERPDSVILKLLRNFDRKLTPSMRNHVKEEPYSLHEIMTVASMIQLETGYVPEMKDVSAVIYNRLKNSRFPTLDMDCTLVYLIGRDKDKELTQADIAKGKDIDSPYNTYKNKGLPPGPICSPGSEALRAALYPANKPGIFFYALTVDGTHKFVADSYSHEQIKKNNPEVYG